MLNRAAVVTAMIAAMNTAGLAWEAPGACLTPSGAPCRTLVYESSGWVNRSWGIHAVERYRDEYTEAVQRDGTAMLRMSHRSFRFYVFPTGNYDRARIVFPLQRRTVELEHSLRERREMGGVWWFLERWKDESDCITNATSAGQVRRKSGRTPTVAGIHSVEYIYESTDHHVVQRIAFAPSLGCTAVEFSLSERSDASLPVSESTLRLTSATLAEPDHALFAIPTVYKLVSPEKQWPYAYLNTFPGNITTTGFSPPIT